MALSIEEALALRHGGGDVKGDAGAKRRRFDRCYSCLEIKIEPGSLEDLNSDKLKMEIKKWAKAVVAYARQFGEYGAQSPKE
ncbi:hypothetical protein HHK36_014268 [Tetracentron sinense]|uniref:Uncharacterized protein n=1 Tax=Tetracentron sinense TaxID=13715 RepID=A0A834Z7U9_TETSI|nr:hypothetical protein HHK36_014268 [Tetracentron sinense]